MSQVAKAPRRILFGNIFEALSSARNPNSQDNFTEQKRAPACTPTGSLHVGSLIQTIDTLSFKAGRFTLNNNNNNFNSRQLPPVISCMDFKTYSFWHPYLVLKFPSCGNPSKIDRTSKSSSSAKDWNTSCTLFCCSAVIVHVQFA